jgi:WD40 repeat protein
MKRGSWQVWVAGIALAQVLVIAAEVALLWPTHTETEENAALLHEELGFISAEKPASEVNNGIRTDRYGDPLPEGALARLGTLRLRHPGGISSLAYSPDGKMLAVFTFDFGGYRGLGWSEKLKRAVHIWDPRTGKRIHRLDSSLRAEPCLAFSGDGKRLLGIGRQDCTLWDTLTGKTLEVPRGIGPGLYAAASPDGTTVALAGLKSLRSLSMTDDNEIRPFEMPENPVFNMVFSKNGATLAGFFTNSKGPYGVCLWEAGTGRRLHKLPPETMGTRLAFTPDGKILATSGINGPVLLWDVKTGEKIRTIGDSDVYWLIAFTRDGKGLLAVRKDGIVLWDVVTGIELRRFGTARSQAYYKAALAPDGKTLAVSARGGVLLFDVATGKELLGLAVPARDVETVGFSPDGKTAFTGADGLSLWDSVTGKLLAAPGPRSIVGGAAFAPDGKSFLVGYSKDQSLRLWDTATGKEVRRFDGHPGEVEFVGFLGDGKSVASISQQSGPNPGTRVRQMRFRVWDRVTGKETRQVGNGMMRLATASADGRRLAAGQDDVYVWDASSGRELAKLSRRPYCPVALTFTPDGRRLAVSFHPVRFWEVLTGTEMGSIPENDTLALAVSPDGRILATGGFEGTVGLWELATGKELRKLKGHDGPVLAISFSPDGRRLISGGRDTTALIWDTADVLPKDPEVRLEVAEVQQLWVALACPDTAAALRAVHRLARAPGQALPYIRENIGEQPTVGRDRLTQLLADLDADSFAKRVAADTELARLGRIAEAGLKRVLERNPSAEVRKRAEALLKKLDDRLVSPVVLQTVRALEVLELIATPEARRVIETLAKGSGDACVREEAEAVLARLMRR